MSDLAPKRLTLGEYTLDAAARDLRRLGETVPLARLPFQVLLYLVEHRDRVVTRAELIERFWDGKDVYDDTLHKCVGAIRKALGDSAANHRFVETRHGKGYRYVGPFEETAPADAPPAVDVVTAPAVEPAVERERADSPRRESLAEPARVMSSVPRRVAVAFLVAAAVVVAVAFRPRTPVIATLPPAPSVPRSIAVLPLDNLSGDPREEFLSDGIAESLIGDLSRVNGLKVISRRSAFAFKGTRVDAREVGRRLGVESILEGSLRRAGDSVHVEVRLVSTDDGRVLWAGSGGGRLTGNVLDVQEALACEVASELRVALCGEGERVSDRYTRNADAYREYLAGRYHWNRRTTEDMREAVDRFESALAADPNYAIAYAGLAETYAVMETNSNAAPGSVSAKGEAAARRALELDDALPGAWAALGLLSTNAFRWDEGERDLKRALDLNPAYAPARQWYAHGLLVRGRFEQAEAELRRAQESDPLSYPIANSLAHVYYHWRKFDRAIAQARAAAELAPDESDPYWTMAMACLALGMKQEALAAAARTSPEGERLVALHVGGNRDEERRYIDHLARSAHGARMPYSIACLYARLGDAESALRWLDRACTARQADAATLKIAPELDLVRSDPRYAGLVRRVGLEP